MKDFSLPRAYCPATILLIAVLSLSGCVTTGSSGGKSGVEQAREALYADRDARTAYERYAEAAEDGDAGAMFQVSRMMLEGQGVARNAPGAMVWLKKAVAGGCPRAKTMYGLYHMNGAHGLPQDQARGLELLAQAVDAGDGLAASSLGAFYSTGQGAPLDLNMAAYWYSRARDLGYPIPVELTTSQGLASLDKPAKPAHTGPIGKAQVAEAQQLLARLGYDPGPVDGLYGKRTANAIMAFQRDKGVNADGKLTPQMLDLIRFSAANR